MNIKSEMYDVIMRVLSKKKKYELEYWRIYHKRGNILNPRRLTEKLFWMTRYNEIYNKDLIRRIYDKYTVREYVKEKGLEKILIPMIGVYNSVEDIDFEKLPNEFILKTTQSSGENIICKDKNNIDIVGIKNKMGMWLSNNNRSRNSGLFNYYYTNNKKIICEELLKDENENIPNDLRICCCNGKPKFIYCDLESVDENMNKKKEYYRECFDLEWNYLDVDFYKRERKNKKKAFTEKPDNLEEILELSSILSKDFLFVRVDFYNVNGKVYFGELTPVPGLAGGFSPDEYDYLFGDMLELPDADIF